MFKTAVIAGVLLCAGIQQAAADGKVFVQLPDLSTYSGAAAERLLSRVVLANVVSSNCPGYEITDAEWSLLTDSADLLAYGQLKLGVVAYDDNYYHPAFAALTKAGTCESIGPDVQPLLDELVALGGSRQPLADQDAAYVEWRALMDRLEAEAKASQPTKKTKTKR